MGDGNNLVFRLVSVLSVKCTTSNGLSDLKCQEFRHIPNVLYSNETLVRSGFLGASPEKPTLAISIELLEIYRQLRRVCPRFSIDALGRALCHIHYVRTSLY
jgi:hypothetical protein